MATLIHELFSHPGTPRSVKSAAEWRLRSDPGVPALDLPATQSFWLSDTHPQFRQPPTTEVPASASVVIIGSGITGTSVARQLVISRKESLISGAQQELPIVLLDAREICSGATGRNGGHCNETGFDTYSGLVQKYGKVAALKILRFRLSHLDTLIQVAKEDGIEEYCQIREVETVVVYEGAEIWKQAKELFWEFKQDLGAEGAGWRMIEDKEEMRTRAILHADGIIVGRAGAMWPYKFVTGVLSKLISIDPNFRVFSETPVESIAVDATGKFVLKTSRGEITADHIVHCTNAHVTHLVPGLRDNIFSIRGHMSAHSTPPTFPIQSGKTSWVFNQSPGYDYLIQLPLISHSDNPHYQGSEMMLGGGWKLAKHFGIEELGVSTDTHLAPEFTKYLSTALNTAFLGTDKKGKDYFRMKSIWSGVLGFSVDELPWVGKLDSSLTGREHKSTVSKDGEEHAGVEWLAAGFSGEGMVNAWLCGKALAMMILGRGREIEEWFPEEMLLSKPRLEKSRITFPSRSSL